MKNSNLMLVVLLFSIVFGSISCKKENIQPEPDPIPVILDHPFIGEWEIFDYNKDSKSLKIIKTFAENFYTFLKSSDKDNVISKNKYNVGYFHWRDYNEVEKSIIMGHYYEDENGIFSDASLNKIINDESIKADVVKEKGWSESEYIIVQSQEYQSFFNKTLKPEKTIEIYKRVVNN